MTRPNVTRLLRVLAVVALAGLWGAQSAAGAAERRIALVIGNAAYPSGQLATAANDAGLIAQTLQAAGFDVVGARDLDGDTLRHTLRDFIDKASAAGPDTVAFVYLAGLGVQYGGENYFVPVDARIDRDTDVPIAAVRLADYLRPLSALPIKARFVVIDAARPNTFGDKDRPLAGGLSLFDPEPGTIVTFNATPGTIAMDGKGPYGAYAQSLAEMIRDAGLTPAELFDRVRLRVASVTQGAFIPWNSGQLPEPFQFFERAADAPRPIAHADIERRRARPIRDFDAEDAFAAAIDHDTLEAYLDFLETYPHHSLAKRVRAIVAARREAMIWRRTYIRDSREAYWTYLDRYPRGPHAWDARRRLRYLAAEMDVPRSFVIIDFDVPPPLPDEIVVVERRVIYFADPDFGFVPPPLPPVFFLPPPPPEFVVLAPPAVIVEAFVLPVPVFVPVARWVEPPRHIVAPPPNVVFQNIHTEVVINNITNTTVTNVTVPPIAGTHGGPPVAVAPVPNGAMPQSPSGTLPSTIANHPIATTLGVAAVAGVGAAALKVALPPAITKQTVVTAPTAGPPLKSAIQPLTAPDGKTIAPPPANSARVPQAATPQAAILHPAPAKAEVPLIARPSTTTKPAATGVLARPVDSDQKAPLAVTKAGLPPVPPASDAAKQSADKLRERSHPLPTATAPPFLAPKTPTAPAAKTVPVSPGSLAITPPSQKGPAVAVEAEARRRDEAARRQAADAERGRQEAERQRLQKAAAAQDAQARAQVVEQQRQRAADAVRARQEAERQRSLREQATAQEAQRRAQAVERQRQQAAEAVRARQAEERQRAQQAAAQEAQRRAQAAESQRRAQMAAEQQRARAQQAAEQAARQQAQAAARAQQARAAEKPKCGIPGTPACPPR